MIQFTISLGVPSPQIQNLEFEAIVAEQQDALQTQIEYQKYLLEQYSNKRKSSIETERCFKYRRSDNTKRKSY